MSLAEHIADHKMLGSWRVGLGSVKEPEGYAIMYNGESHYYWLRDDGVESCISVSKWDVLEWAKADSKTRGKLLNEGK